ncbi:MULTISPECIES: Ldh family oxidoreductase [Pseudonocardia]|uniref:(2R)-3-sulfolactate dehydrogenase (NADP(+)) n=2 Tax=Pseudonocardia TaxID=1847 RepID=A0A1Y2MW79_PSEAH|nr:MULTISPECIES: Ldh family oxidoreductase [Pseudonocardia]OSY38888.1 (2R)-3-sulfolactate dehydrogenase (NADP(+)) [Pseudonocardia autotrophica]TDN76144.1 LDH2 family malate/lactate/ureidoglycolate dehydrogenase [Pseudonocardia autotrophica]BBG00125.1 delta(1)-pyrroline-2-carboxylate/Delta(1)-piperideine-2-carboxylate reductase [Pseudonocardia autotrophica]GEC26090.1 delta(1)-pyrroline-2-carboxylate/Delta(1)-piperid eine-2-carboxylate reductase [Pseudonocardia saturnea]
MSETVTLTLQDVHEVAVAVLTAHGFDDTHAGAIADTVTAAERDECPHHGLFRIPYYVDGVRSGLASGVAQPELSELAPAVVRVDARYTFAPLSLALGEEPLAALAAEHGIAALVVNNALHVAALWPEVERLAERDLVAFAFVAAAPYVAPAGGREPLFGTNPMAFAWPRGDRPPLAFDQASSACARGEIQLRLRDGRELPDGAAIGPDGLPTSDPAQALAGAQLPFGGAKGSNIALMIELLTGPLLGDLLSIEAGERDTARTGAPCGGELVIAMDPARFSVHHDREARIAHGEKLFAKILEQEGTRLPSDRRYEARLRTPSEGVTIPASLYATLDGLRGGYEPEPA